LSLDAFPENNNSSNSSQEEEDFDEQGYQKSKLEKIDEIPDEEEYHT